MTAKDLEAWLWNYFKGFDVHLTRLRKTYGFILRFDSGKTFKITMEEVEE